MVAPRARTTALFASGSSVVIHPVMVLRKITFAVEARVGDHVMSRPGAPLDAITFDEDDFEYVTTEKLAEVALGLMTLKQQSGADSPRYVARAPECRSLSSHPALVEIHHA